MPITKRQFIELCRDMPDDAILVQSQDPEGNGFVPTFQIERGHWRGDDAGGGLVESGEVGGTRRRKGDVPAIVLWPAR